VIYQLDEDGIHEVGYEETQQYQLTRYFLNNYKTMVDEVLQAG
jgi:predicted ATPase